MWNELSGTYQVVAGTANGAITLPTDGQSKTQGLILIGWFLRTVTSAAQSVVIVGGGQIGSVTITIPGPSTFEKHFNHLLFTPITSITPSNFAAGDSWMFEFVKRMNT